MQPMSYSYLDQEFANSLLETTISALPITPIILLVVDDHALVRAAISQALSPQPEVKLVATAQDYAEAEAHATQLHPDIIWLDMHIARCDGIAEIRRLRQLVPAARIMVLADEEDEQEAFAAIMAGAQGYRSKQDVDPDEIMNMIHMLYQDEFVLRPVLLARLIQRLRSAVLPLWESENGTRPHGLLRNGEYDGLAELTIREREILQLISQGCRDRDIAEGLHISEKTVQKHVQSILSKLGAQNRTEAAYFIHRQLAS
jgi:two-component system, NarL family, response regulator LiaR